MKVTKEDLKKSKIKLTIEVEPKELAVHNREAFEKIAQGVKIDGFRPGKAPFKLVEAAVGHNRLIADGIDAALNASYIEALKQEKLSPLSNPEVNIKKSPQFSLDETEILDNLVYEATFDIMPEVTLQDYSKLSLKTPKKEEAKDADVEKIIDHLRKQKATFKDVERGAKKGDRIEINYDGFLKKVKIDRMCSKNHPMILGEGNLIPGFEEEVVGMKKGEKKEFKIKFPKDYHDKEIAGKDAEFHVTLVDLKEVILPELNDDFAKAFGHNTVKKLNDAIRENLELEMEQNYRNKLEMDVVDKVLPLLKVETPESLIHQEIDRMIDGFRQQVESNGLAFDKYLEGMKKSIGDLEKEMHDQAEKNVRVGLMLGKIIEKEKIDPKDDDAGRKALDKIVKALTK